MARIARDSTPKRRSARLSNNQSAAKSAPSKLKLDAVMERDETPDVQPSIDAVVATPSTSLKDRFVALSKIATPKTEPKPDSNQMHPATIHQTTAKAPDSGLKLGFADISTTGRASVASLQNTPSRPRQSLATTNISPSYQFKFNHESNMSDEGRKLMDSIRKDASRIKEKMRAEKEEEERHNLGTDAAGRKIAKPTAKSGRFSEVHMAQFKKMDSIADHASSFRARPGFSRPTTQSLKRTSSKANLDEPERPKTAGKSPSARIPPPISGRPTSLSPFKSIPQPSQADSKRARREGDEDVSSNRPTTIPQPVCSRLLSPTKASAARVSSSTSPSKPSTLHRSPSQRSIRSVSRPSATVIASASKIPQPHLDKALPPTPREAGAHRSEASSPAKPAGSSKIPTFANLKSILRSPKKGHQSETPKKVTANVSLPPSSQKKVDFTPSVKCRYAEKLAEASPSPAKLDRANRTSEKWEPAIPYDSSAFFVKDDSADWESNDEDTQVVYPNLPALSRPVSRAGPVDHTFSRHAKEHGRRESTQFKSIFTKCDPNASRAYSLSGVNTANNRTDHDAAAKPRSAAWSPRKPNVSSTIRQISTSGTFAAQVQPFEDLPIPTMPHGLPGKKRRIEEEHKAKHSADDTKENMPGAWRDSVVPDNDSDDEGAKRGAKRARLEQPSSIRKLTEQLPRASMSPLKKPSAAREAAAKVAKERKVKASIGSKLTASRLNALAQPKQR